MESSSIDLTKLDEKISLAEGVAVTLCSLTVRGTRIELLAAVRISRKDIRLGPAGAEIELSADGRRALLTQTDIRGRGGSYTVEFHYRSEQAPLRELRIGRVSCMLCGADGEPVSGSTDAGLVYRLI